MPLIPPPRMNAPEDAGSFVPNDGTTPVDPSAGAAPVPGESNPGAMEDMHNILQITSAARSLASKYPTAVPEVQSINDAVQKLQLKIMSVQPPAEVTAPPQ